MILLKKILLLSLLPLALFSKNRFDNFKLVSAKSNELVYQISFNDIQIKKNYKDNGIIHSISSKKAIYPESGNIYNLPSQLLNIAIPENGDITYQVISKTQKTINGINLKPSILYDDVSDLSEVRPFIESSPKSRFRDFNYKTLQINHVSYDVNSKTVTITDNISLKISISGQTNNTNKFKPNGKLDNVYSDFFVNFEQAQNWQIPKEFKFSKKVDLGYGLYYEIKVIEDGIYKVTASFLRDNGIDIDNLNIKALQLYNNGGHQLSLATTSTQFNPATTQEAAIIVYDLNLNNIFDDNDYFLFYGKSLNSWYFNLDSDNFEHQKHMQLGQQQLLQKKALVPARPFLE